MRKIKCIDKINDKLTTIALIIEFGSFSEREHPNPVNLYNIFKKELSMVLYKHIMLRGIIIKK